VKGPDVVWYLCVAGFLFSTGALGVPIRRSPLIVLLAGDHAQRSEPALIAFSRHFAQGDGQIFALTVMAVAASEVVVGLGLIVAIARQKLDLDVDKLSTLRG
jgi:NADH-quinone oxidoreductase subunit K